MTMAEALGLRPLAARNLCTVGTSKATLGDPDGVAALERCIREARDLQSVYLLWNATVNLATVFSEWGELDRVPELYEDLAVGNESDRRWMLIERAALAYQLGDWDEATSLVDAFGAAASMPHYMDFEAADLQARFAVARGDVETAMTVTEGEIELSRSIADPQSLLVALGTRIKCLREAGRLAETEPLLDEILAAWKASEAVTGMAAALDVAWTLRELGREHHLLEILDAKAWLARWFEAAKLVLRGDLAGAAELCERIGSVPEAAEAHLRAAEALQAGDPQQAEHANRALELCRRLDAPALADRAEALVTRG
jgi:hypothetical protein